MNRFCRLILMMWLPASLALAQGPAAETPRVGSAQAAVTVVFAPDYHLPPRPSLVDRNSNADQRASLRSVDTLPARILTVMTGGRINADAGPVEFPAPKGLIGIKTGVESVMAATATIGEDGKVQFDCLQLTPALERLKSASSALRFPGKETGNDK